MTTLLFEDHQEDVYQVDMKPQDSKYNKNIQKPAFDAIFDCILAIASRCQQLLQIKRMARTRRFRNVSIAVRNVHPETRPMKFQWF